MRSRVVSIRPSWDSSVCSKSGTPGGGGGGGVPRRTSMTHFPLSTGEVLLAWDVRVRMLP